MEGGCDTIQPTAGSQFIHSFVCPFACSFILPTLPYSSMSHVPGTEMGTRYKAEQGSSSSGGAGVGRRRDLPTESSLHTV